MSGHRHSTDRVDGYIVAICPNKESEIDGHFAAEIEYGDSALNDTYETFASILPDECRECGEPIDPLGQEEPSEVLTDGGVTRGPFPNWDDRLRQDDVIRACHQAVRQWGEQAQLNKAAEESGELAAAINRLLNPESERNDPVEELIDARLVMEVVSTLYPTEEMADKMDEQVADFKRRVAEDSPDGDFIEVADKCKEAGR